MIECLKSYIGLKGVTENTTSDIYINDLHGISTHQLEISREIEENDGIAESWATIEDRAIRSFETDLLHNLKRYYQSYQIIDSGLTGIVEDNVLADHGSGKYSGWLFDMSTYSSSLKLEVNDVRVHLSSAETFNVKIFDANTGEELFTKEVTGSIGVNVIKILESFSVYNHNKIFVAYDSVIPIRVYNTPSIPGQISQGSISVGSTVLADQITSTETGISVGYNVRCAIDEFVCSRLELFLEPFLYKLGIEFVKYTKYSDSFNRFNLLNNDDKNELIDDYKEDYKMLIDSAFKDLNVPDDGICFICNKAISKKVLLP